MTNKNETTVDVKIPQIALTLDDLVFLKGLAPGNRRCYGSSKTRNKMLFLGLVENGELPPCPKEVAQWRIDQIDLPKKADAALRKGDWQKLSDIAYKLRSRSKPEATKDLVLTEAGIQLLKRGQAQSVTAKSKGCL